MLARSARTQTAVYVDHTDLPIAKPRKLAQSARIHFAFAHEQPQASEIEDSTYDHMPVEASGTRFLSLLPRCKTI